MSSTRIAGVHRGGPGPTAAGRQRFFWQHMPPDGEGAPTRELGRSNPFAEHREHPLPEFQRAQLRQYHATASGQDERATAQWIPLQAEGISPMGVCLPRGSLDDNVTSYSVIPQVTA